MDRTSYVNTPGYRGSLVDKEFIRELEYSNNNPTMEDYTYAFMNNMLNDELRNKSVYLSVIPKTGLLDGAADFFN